MSVESTLPTVVIVDSDLTELGTATDPLRVDPTGTTAQPVTDNGGSLTVDVGTALPPGTNNIGDVDVVTIPAPLSTTGGGTEAAALRVTIANDSTGVVSVDDNGGSLTVDGSVTVSGLKSNDNGAPGATNLGTLPAIATAAAPSYTEGNQVGLSSDLAGNLRITGSISATNPSVGSNNSASPASSTQIGGSDGTDLQAARVFDADSGGGTQYVLGAILRKSASGGSVEAGTSADPLRVDPTGTTAQPVTDNGGSLTVDTPQLPAALVGGRLDVVVGAALPTGTNNIGDVDVLTVPAPLSTTGGGTEATALRVTLANDSTGVLSVDDNGGALTVNGAGTAGSPDTNVVTVQGIAAGTAIPVSATYTNMNATIEKKGHATATLANVAGSTSSVTLLAANANRRGAMIANDSAAILYVKFGTTASSTSYTVRMVSNAYYELPFEYTGIITGIWTAATGNARVTEVTD